MDSLLLCCLPLQYNQSLVNVICTSELQKLHTKQNLLAPHNITLGFRQLMPLDRYYIASVNHELKLELQKLGHCGNPVAAVDLLRAVCMLNSQTYSNGLSRKQMFFNSRCNEMNVSKVVNLNTEVRHSYDYRYKRQCTSKSTPNDIVSSLSCEVYSLNNIKRREKSDCTTPCAI